MQMYRIYIFLLFMLCTSVLKAQDSEYVVAFGKFKIEWGNTDGSGITLYRDGAYEDEQFTKKNGKFQFELELNHNYLFEFTKPGYVSKRVEFNTSVPQNILESPEFVPFPDFDFHVTLFKVYPDVDTMFFVNPVGKIAYSAEINDFDWDKDYTLEILRRMEEIEEEIKAIHEREEKKRTQKKDENKTENKPQAEDKIAVKQEIAPAKEEEINSDNSKIVEPAIKPNKKTIQKPLVKPSQEKPKPIKNITPASARKEIIELPGRTQTRITVNRDNVNTVYVMVKHSWGATFYFIELTDGSMQSISQSIYLTQTKP